MCFSVSSANTIVMLLVYRPGSVQANDVFFAELDKCLEVIALYKCEIVVAGDFNIHVERPDDPHAIRLREVLSSFDCIQHVPHTPTHGDEGTLNFVINDIGVNPPEIISDHRVISWRLIFQQIPSIAVQREVRCWSKVDKTSFEEGWCGSL